MKCPYQDIGCWYIDDVSHECEASSMGSCHHASHQQEPARDRKKEEDDNESNH